MINTSALDQRPLYELPALVLHEGAPGHHIQTALAQEQTGVPDFRKTALLRPPTARAGASIPNGWREEMGIYRDPYELFGRLSYEMWRACRLVADTGIHAQHWTLDQAKACFLDNTALSPTNIDVEVARYISLARPGPGLQGGRAEDPWNCATEPRRPWATGSTSGPSTTPVLLNGSLPLAVLEAKIDAWIAARKK